MKVEFFHTEGCRSCSDSRNELRAAALRVDPAVAWREVDAVKELDYAVEVGVAALPAVAIDGKLLLSALTPEQLAGAMHARRGEVANGRG